MGGNVKYDRALLTWIRDESEWTAISEEHDDGTPFVWKIVVQDDGSFTVDESDPELTESDERFYTLQDAKAFCQRLENELMQAGA